MQLHLSGSPPLAALGGAQRLSSLTSFVAKGTYDGYDTHGKVPVEVFAKAPGQRTIIVHAPGGESTATYDGRAGWIASQLQLYTLPIALTGGELAGAKLDAELSFPARINWRADFPTATIDDHAVQVIQGPGTGPYPIKLYFDKQSGLLVRVVRSTETMVGPNPTEIDYADYREVSGVKMPFRWIVTWADGRSTIQLSRVQANAPIDAAKFAKPNVPDGGR